MTTPQDNLPMRELIEAAEAVVARWYSPKWKDEPHTGEFINRLRAAIAAQDGRQTVSREVVAWLRVSNITEQVTGAFLTENCELRTERLEPLGRIVEAQPVQIPPAALTEFIEKFCDSKSELVATAEAAHHWFNKNLQPSPQPRKQG
ncbi:MAG: hypothetical protein V4631_20950 [Pseudomonadota bacterium]